MGEEAPRVCRTADEIARLKSKVGEITMDNELLYAKIEALEGKRPLSLILGDCASPQYIHLIDRVIKIKAAKRPFAKAFS